MATSSITHNFVVSNPKSVQRFVAALEKKQSMTVCQSRHSLDAS